jgi:hypothetical protein
MFSNTVVYRKCNIQIGHYCCINQMICFLHKINSLFFCMRILITKAKGLVLIDELIQFSFFSEHIPLQGRKGEQIKMTFSS